jgi:hypothetical protein
MRFWFDVLILVRGNEFFLDVDQVGPVRLQYTLAFVGADQVKADLAPPVDDS